MKKWRIILIICILSPTLFYAQERLITSGVAAVLSAKEFDNLLITTYKQGLTAKGQTPEIQRRIDERVEVLELLKEEPKKKLSREEIDELGRLGISADLIRIISEIGVEEALRRLGQEVPADPKQAKQKLANEIKGQTEQESKEELGEEAPAEAPPPPGAPPPPPPAPGVPAPEAPAPEEPPAPVDPILETLSADDMAGLSDKQRQESDELFIATIRAAAERVVLFGEQGKIKPLQKLKRRPQFANAYQGYLFYITDMLIVEAGQKDTFYKRDELRALVGVGQDSTLETYANENLQVSGNPASFFQNRYDALSKEDLVTNLITILRPCVFDEAALRQLADDARTLAINILVSQREVPPDPETIGRLDKIKSDALVAGVLQDILQKIMAVPKKRQDDKEVPDFTPERNYIPELSAEIDRLRIHPDFLKFAGLLPTVDQVLEQFVGMMMKDMPLVRLLKERDPGEFNPGIILAALPDQLFFDRDQFEASVMKPQTPESFAFKGALVYHKEWLLTQLPEVNIQEFLNESFEVVDSIDTIRATLTMLKKKAPGKKRPIDAILKEFKSFTPDPDTIIAQFKQLADVTAFEKQVRTVIEQEREKKKGLIALLEALERAKAEYQKTQRPVSTFILNFLKPPKLDQGTSAALERELMALYRTPLSVRGFFSRRIGVAAEIEKRAKKQDFYAWVEPYGLLLNVLNEWNQEVAKKPQAPVSEHRKLLIDSLLILNKAAKKPDEEPVEIVMRESELFQAGIYKDTVAPMLQAIEADDPEGFVQLITEFVRVRSIKKDKKGVEDSPAFKQLMNEWLRTYIFVGAKGVAQEVAMLNTGGLEEGIEGLALEGVPEVGRNAAIYTAIIGMFDPLAALLPAIIEKDIAAVVNTMAELSEQDLDRVIQAISAAIEQRLQDPAAKIKYITDDEAAERATIMGHLDTYLDDTKQRIMRLQKAATGVTAPAAAPEVEVPEGPPPAPPPPPA